jgi:hypothetical protein
MPLNLDADIAIVGIACHNNLMPAALALRMMSRILRYTAGCEEAVRCTPCPASSLGMPLCFFPHVMMQ